MASDFPLLLLRTGHPELIAAETDCFGSAYCLPAAAAIAPPTAFFASLIVVSSFAPGVLKALRAQDATIPLGLICEFKTQLQLWSELPVQYMIPHYALAEPDLIRKIKGAGKKVIVWTVNDPADMQRFAESGVDGIISDDTALLCRTLAA